MLSVTLVASPRQPTASLALPQSHSSTKTQITSVNILIDRPWQFIFSIVQSIQLLLQNVCRVSF